MKNSQSALFILALLLLPACSSLGVQPWERGQFAREDMQPDTDEMDMSIEDHIYFSKEASSGGRTLAGGGCGCN
ncbi:MULTISPECIES: DUF4266 domain-containing protein [Shewanella]|uniref:DUF4266 domain-containing protein n=1 Tax=Shewanella marisflavi TaxID=260364 RepID=A0AAC9TZZ9_9GAMM|nr:MULTISPECIES: DUF4266 domain-containing protein [Shewanella]ASJ96858.1 hypothetical protein CFF01_09860 [Shewanella marisflavi]MCL1041060.1 DUF4266 domain-containing protein [Shewanella marisflavi]QDF75396.1 DUF4266 domain-containing protein [Shewanella marisflavi]